jgi:AAA ATPase domain
MAVVASEPRRRATHARERLRAQTAPLVWFDVEWLDPPGDEAAADQEVSDFLISDCRMVHSEDGLRHWALTDQVRKRVASELGRDRLLASLREATHQPPDRAQAAIARALEGHVSPIQGRPRREIAADLQVAQWFADVLPDLGDVVEIAAELEREELLEPLRAFINDGFYGRTTELGRLHAHLRDDGGLPLVLSGVGGVGKSTLLAKFVTDVVDGKQAIRFAYLNFDRGALTADRPMLLLAEIARQVALQVPERGATWSWVIEDLRSIDASELQARGRASQQTIESLDSPAVAGVTGKAMDFLGSVSRDGLLLVLDTFEEVQRQRSTTTYLLWSLLARLRSSVPIARVVISGRALDRGLPFDSEPLELLELDDASAMRMLLQAPNLRISEVVARRTIDLVTRNPLSLRLAIDVLRESGPDDPLLDLELQEGQIQGQLYRRILLHIDNPKVRQIAHPGLVVRVVTPDVIRHVLARPCGLRDIDDEEAQELFAGLELEATLVRSDGTALRHRSDVRELMLPALERDQKPTVDKIHRSAIRYYRDLDGADARAEELYHRLMLGQSRRTLDEHWNPATVASLRSSLDELPARGQAYLAAAAPDSISVPAAILRTADADEWANATKASALAEIRAGRPEQALELVRARRGSDGESLLPTVEVEALEALRKFDEALDVLSRTRASALRRSKGADAVTLTLARVRVLERMGDFAAARDEAKNLRESLARGRGESALDYLVATTTYLRLLRRSSREDSDEYRDAVAAAVTRAERLPRRELASRPGLLRELLAEIGDASPKLLAFGVGEVGVARGHTTALDEELTNVDATDDTADDFSEEARSRTGVKVTNYVNEVGLAPSFSNAIKQSYQGETDELYS